MSRLVAIDVAILPPAEVSARVVALSAALPASEPPELRLDADHRPHITLTQQFVREEELDTLFEHVDGVLRGRPRFPVTIVGGGHSGHTVSLIVESNPELSALHEQLMEALRGLERSGGTPAAFAGDDARVADLLWVSGYRLKSSFGHFQPHITLGHAPEPPAVERFTFDADTVAVCHLGRFCTCQRVLRSWALPGA